MARPTKEPPSPSSLVPALVRYARGLSIDVEALAWRFDLPLDVERREEVSVAASTPNDLMAAIARGGLQPDLALRLAGDLPSPRHTLAELAIRASMTLRDALVRLARWAPLLHDGLEASLEEGLDHEVRWVVRTPHRPRGLGRYIHELAPARAWALGRAGGGAVASRLPASGSRIHARPTSMRFALSSGTRELAFGCEDTGFALVRKGLDSPMLAADARACNTPSNRSWTPPCSRARSATSFAERIATHVASALPQWARTSQRSRGRCI